MATRLGNTKACPSLVSRPSPSLVPLKIIHSRPLVTHASSAFLAPQYLIAWAIPSLAASALNTPPDNLKAAPGGRPSQPRDLPSRLASTINLERSWTRHT